ncbi:MAG: hypothetical protein K0R63_1408 [Rickettsiales bacterium]|jgi:putative membrane protein insertion efficiency factor|nr:hypothetical protein [Rickettsiales bacterium]
MMQIIARMLAEAIRWYQILFSSVLPPCCRFSPTCSAYGREALKLHGPVYGLWLTVCRISRCHPWGKSGFDPVPPRISKEVTTSTTHEILK